MYLFIPLKLTSFLLSSVFLVPLCIMRDSFIQITFNEVLSLECRVGQIEYETIQTLDNSQMQNDS